MKEVGRRTRSRWVTLVLVFLSTVTIYSCAKQGFPSGGPKDTEPPVALSCHPDNESRNFDRTQFYVEFNEYVVLKDATNNVLVSPPLKTKPEYSTRKKGILVRLSDTLQPNTTYLFQFKDAIADFTEGNVLSSFEYVFSTGESMDTMMLAGRVLQARNGKPWEEAVSVMAYKESRFEADSADTIAIWGQPDLVTRTDKEGNFAFHYIPSDRYRMVALADKNRDLRAAASEAIAWDTTFYRSTSQVDSNDIPVLPISAPDTRRQRLLKAEFKDKGHVVVSTALPMQAPTLTGDSVIWRKNTIGDTMHLWLVDRSVDSLRVVLSDSASALCDTLRLRYTAPSSKRGRNKQNSKPLEQPLMRALCAGNNAYYDDLWLDFTNPIASTADSLTATVMNLKDSTIAQCTIELDSTGLKARLMASLVSEGKYRIHLRDSLFTDIYGTPSDSLTFTLSPKDYGILNMQIVNQTGIPLVVELLDSRDTMMDYKLVGTDGGAVQFTHVKAGEYRIRAILDADSNGTWTTGDYRLGRQPERFLMYEKSLQLREKWEMEEKWTVRVETKKAERLKTLPKGFGTDNGLPKIRK